MNRNNKAFSLAMAMLLCMAMLAPIFVAPPSAQALATVSASTVPTVLTGGDQVLGTVVVSDNGTNMSGATIQVQLPTGVAYEAKPANQAAFESDYTVFPKFVGGKQNVLSGADTLVYDAAASTDKVLVFSLDGSGQQTPGTDQCWAFGLTFDENGKSACEVSESGDVVISLMANNFSIPAGTTVVNARTSAGGTTNFALSKPLISEQNGVDVGAIEILEVTKGALTTNTSFEVSFPEGCEILDCAIVTTAPFTLVTKNAPTFNTSGESTMRFNVTNYTEAANAGFIMLTFNLKVTSLCDDGDIVAKLKSTGGAKNITEGDITVATKGNFNVEVTASDPPVLNNGLYDQTISTITLNEEIAGSLLDGRTITFSLPDNARWVDIPTVHRTTGNVTIDGGDFVVGTDRREVSYNITSPAVPSRSEIDFKNGTIALEADGPVGDVKVTIGGTTAVDEEVTVASAQAPVTASVDPINNVIIGLQDQPVSDIVITEVAAEAVKARLISGAAANNGNIAITLPDGVKWSSRPTLAVTGDLDINETNISINDEVLTIPVISASDEASTITLSGVEVTSDRTVPEGPIQAEISGTSLDQTSRWEGWMGIGSGEVNRAAAVVTIANCVTPAPSETLTEYTSSFSLGSTIYYVNGMAKMMDVPVMAQDGRIFVPQRFLGKALGIADENIVWDQATQTATFTTDDGRVATCTVGSNIITVDGVETTMDVQPLVVDNRILLPARFLTEALGGTVGWDQGTKTAFVNIAA